jgi:hypothetical protein
MGDTRPPQQEEACPGRSVTSWTSAFGRDLYYLEAAERPSAMWRLPVSGGGAPTRPDDDHRDRPWHHVAPLSASRDGRTVFFSKVDSSADELMLVENFR